MLKNGDFLRPKNQEVLIEQDNRNGPKVRNIALNAVNTSTKYIRHPIYATLEEIVTEKMSSTQYQLRVR